MVLEMLNLIAYLEIMVLKNKTQKKVLIIQNCRFSFAITASPC